VTRPGSTFGRRAGALAAAGLFAAAALVGCPDRLVHPFGGNEYDPARDCLGPAQETDVVAGADPGPCAQTKCWISSGDLVWVTTTACDAPPDYVDGTNAPAGSPCAKALAAHARGATCPADDSGAPPAADAAAPDAGAADAADAAAPDAGARDGGADATAP
jgi:hypothetical protein